MYILPWVKIPPPKKTIICHLYVLNKLKASQIFLFLTFFDSQFGLKILKIKKKTTATTKKDLVGSLSVVNRIYCCALPVAHWSGCHGI